MSSLTLRRNCYADHPGVGRLVFYPTLPGAIHCEYSVKILKLREPCTCVRADTQTGLPSTTLIIVVVGVMDLSSKPDAISSERNWASVRSWPPGYVSIVMSIS